MERERVERERGGGRMHGSRKRKQKELDLNLWEVHTCITPSSSVICFTFVVIIFVVNVIFYK